MKEQELEQAEARLREEFNRWAQAGRGEEMAEEHAAIAAGMLAQMTFAPNDKILDIGCGAGWLCGILADKVPQGQVVGMDVADEMVRRARHRYADRVNLMFISAGAGDIPWDDNFFNHAVSVESAYYWPHPPQALVEILRVLQPGGTLRLLINLYKENVYSHPWREKLGVPTHLLSGDEWCELLEQAGFHHTRHARVPDLRPVPAGHQSKWFRTAEELANFRRQGALLVYGEKPSPL
ncbi:MAG: methyltransferase domain-containing protein [Acidobacteria bacterium]|nr:methyltransferase domain-containing protein [Acidobacteriota bacterium]